MIYKEEYTNNMVVISHHWYITEQKPLLSFQFFYSLRLVYSILVRHRLQLNVSLQLISSFCIIWQTGDWLVGWLRGKKLVGNMEDGCQENQRQAGHKLGNLLITRLSRGIIGTLARGWLASLLNDTQVEGSLTIIWPAGWRMTHWRSVWLVGCLNRWLCGWMT